MLSKDGKLALDTAKAALDISQKLDDMKVSKGDLTIISPAIISDKSMILV